MQESLVAILRCPLTRSRLSLNVLRKTGKILDGQFTEIIADAILYADNHCFYPVINGIPRLTIDAIIDHELFLKKHIPDFPEKKNKLFEKYGNLINSVAKKNRRTKMSFSKEWAVFDHSEDKTWGADEEGMLARFLTETGEELDSLKNKIIFDAGCGNGLLNLLLAKNSIKNIAMDFSNSIEKPFELNTYSCVHFIQGDIQFPPVSFGYFDIVHCSGVLIHTKNTELSFSCIEPLVMPGGKLSVWVYHKRKNFTHNLINQVRKLTSVFPASVQLFVCRFILFPIGFFVKRLKGNKQNSREMLVDILDWFTPEFRWEHSHEEVESWFYKRHYNRVQVTTNGLFGFNITGIKY